MGTCSHHPDLETSYICMKHNVYLCEDCLQCRDPKRYCNFRESCPIWFMSRKKSGRDAEPQPEGYDGIAVGFWLQAGKPDAKAAAYL